jgi:signal transduction histidine kinase
MEPQGHARTKVAIRPHPAAILHLMTEHQATTPGRSRAQRSRKRAGSPISRPVLDVIRAVVDPLPEAVLVADAEGAIRLANQAADRLFSASPVRTVKDLLSRFEPADTAEAGPSGQPPSSREVVRPRNQPNTWFRLDRTALGPADAAATIFVLRDVSATPDLGPEREAFLGVLSHELRTPLTTIYAGSSVLANRPWLSPPATRTLARDISSEAARLYDLVENLLVIARLERRILQPLDEVVDLGRVVESAVRLTTARFPDARVSSQGTSTAPRVRGDATYVEQACRNLLLAALRAPAAGEDADVTIRVDGDSLVDQVAVRVLDRGPALVNGESEHLYDLPTASTTGRMSSSGVGPYVARQAVEAMGGRTWARNRHGGGVEMGFALRGDPAGRAA